MKHTATKSILITLASIALLSISGTALAITNAGLKACKMAVLEKPKLHDLPMAAVSVYPGNKSGKAHFSVRWDGLRAEGNCKVSGSYVEKVKINEFTMVALVMHQRISGKAKMSWMAFIGIGMLECGVTQMAVNAIVAHQKMVSRTSLNQ